MEVNVIVDSTCACGEVVMHLTLSLSTRQRTKGAASPLDYMIEFKKLQPKVPLYPIAWLSKFLLEAAG